MSKMISDATIASDSVKAGAPTHSPMRATVAHPTDCDVNNADGDMFSPTSAAALALSTLHQHGADRNKRPEDLKGTRLFIQGETKEENEQEERASEAKKETQVPAACPTYYSNGTPPLPAHYPPPPPGYQYAPDPRYSQLPGASPWQPAQFHQYPSVSWTILLLSIETQPLVNYATLFAHLPPFFVNSSMGRRLPW